MPSDIRLDGEHAKVAAERFIVLADAIELESPTMEHPQSGSDSPVRRALAHAHPDKLVVNPAGDYSEGVQVGGHKLGVLGDAAVGGDLNVGGQTSLGHTEMRGSLEGKRHNRDLLEIVASGVILINAQQHVTGAPRVALTHTPENGLLVNKGGGYAAGVTVEGALRVVQGDLTAFGAQVSVLRIMRSIRGEIAGKSWLRVANESLVLSNPKVSNDEQGPALTHTLDDKLVLNHGASYTGGVVIEGQCTLQSASGPVVVTDELATLREQVDVLRREVELLKQRVSTLEATP